MGRRLVRHEVKRFTVSCQFRHDLCGISLDGDRERTPFGRRRAYAGDAVLERLGGFVEIPRLEPACDPRRVDLDAENRRPGHRRRQRLCSAHPAEAGGEDRAAGQVGRAEMHFARSRERLVGALQDPLGADVDPAPGGHLPEHRQPFGLEAPELVPRRPARHEQ